MSLVLLLTLLTAADGLVVLPDGRRAHILKDDAAISSFIQSRVVELATAAIADKGAFSMSIGSGTTVKPLVELAGKMDWNKVHVFFGNERTEGDAAGKCFDGAAVFITACGLNPSHVYRVPSLPADEAAQEYEAMIRGASADVVGSSAGLPALDLVLLGSGADGHCASLYPESVQVECSPGSGRVCVPAEGKGGITLTIDMISSARHVLLSAGKKTQAAMVRSCLGWSGAAHNTKWPAGMVSAGDSTQVEWLLTEDSAIELPAL